MSNLPKRFWDKVKKTETCWVWTAGKNTSGYGVFSLNGKSLLSHRLAWEDKDGSIPTGLVIDHICRNRVCCNPKHLRVVTPKVNALENSFGESAINASKTECTRGHTFSYLNTHVRPDNAGRECRACHRLRSAKHQQTQTRKDYMKQYRQTQSYKDYQKDYQKQYQQTQARKDYIKNYKKEYRAKIKYSSVEACNGTKP